MQRVDARRGEPPLDRLARAGFAAKGVLYLVIGVLAGGLAVGAGGEEASQQGAIRTLAQQPFGRALVAALALGLTAYALWRASQAVWREPAAASDLPDWLARTSFAVRAVLYAAMALLAWTEVVGANGSSHGTEQSVTAALLAMPGGQALVIVVGLVVITVGGVQFREGWTGGFRDHLDLQGVGARGRRAVDLTGRAGHVARGAVFMVAGGFLVRAALSFDTDEGVGLDAALGEVRQAPYGPYLLAAVTAGLLLYGVFCLIESRYAAPARAD